MTVFSAVVVRTYLAREEGGGNEGEVFMSVFKYFLEQFPCQLTPEHTPSSCYIGRLMSFAIICAFKSSLRSQRSRLTNGARQFHSTVSRAEQFLKADQKVRTFQSCCDPVNR